MLEEKIKALQAAALDRIGSAETPAALEAIRIDVLGRKGSLAQFSKEFGKLTPEQRASAGKALNAAKEAIEQAFAAKDKAFSDVALAKRLEAEWIDLTLPAPGVRPGSLHPVTQIQAEIEDLFTSLGFAVLDGPEVEDEYHNFDALNIPAEHPARDMQDTFWLADGHLLRTHTSPVQVRGMEKLGPPLRMIAPGRVFRNEEVDASHEHTFYQLEGMMIDREVSVANLTYFMKTLLSSIFKRDVTVRLRLDRASDQLAILIADVQAVLAHQRDDVECESDAELVEDFPDLRRADLKSGFIVKVYFVDSAAGGDDGQVLDHSLRPQFARRSLANRTNVRFVSGC